MAPSGRTPKPAPNVARLASSCAVSLPDGKEQPAEEDRQAAVEIEVVPLEQRAERRSDDHPAELVGREGHSLRTGSSSDGRCVEHAPMYRVRGELVKVGALQPAYSRCR